MKINFSTKKYTLCGAILALLSSIILLLSINVPLFNRVFVKQSMSIASMILNLCGLLLTLFGVIIKKEK